MQTLETMTQGTKIGSYAAFLYGLIIAVASAITFFVQTNEAVKQNALIAQEVSSAYGLSESSANNLMCFHGILHYKNVGLFSGYLVFSPNIPCSEAEMKMLQENPAEEVAYVAFLFLLIGLLVTFLSYLNLIKKNY
ncbi:MAG: hypothetical protein U9N57_09570 [Pseudomonadota bacterium]|nr:hypothetical protein [Pseudomonadota bacterium]